MNTNFYSGIFEILHVDFIFQLLTSPPPHFIKQVVFATNNSTLSELYPSVSTYNIILIPSLHGTETWNLLLAVA